MNAASRLSLSFVLLTLAARAQPVALESVVVSATRMESTAERVPFSVRTRSGDELRQTPALTLDGALRSIPAFSLFRRSDSLTANPTAQGVSLRGLGPSGASRSLVLLDGVPLNDPFGGWVAWSKVPRESLAGVEIVPGGGATAWGNAALGGVVHLFTESAEQDSARVAALGGSRETRGGEGALTRRIGPGTLQLLGRVFTSEGFSTVAPDRRGSIDVPAGGRHRWLTARWRQALSATTELTLTGRAFEETRANGTPFQRNTSEEVFGSVMLKATPRENFTWTATLYAQDQSFSSTFSSVNATRTAETPASDQFAVPAVAIGAAWTGGWTHANDTHTSAGVDARQVRGETREDATFANGAFTRRRFAGGEQLLAGLFALHERPLTSTLRGSLGARLDHYRETDGHRREIDLINGAVLRDDLFAGSEGWEFSPSAGLVWRASKALRLRAAAQHAFRRPTLNELYRPFRVGNVITEANANLATETVTSGELAADFTRGAVSFSVAAFWNEMRDAVGNVTVARGPGNVPGFGFIPAGGVGRRRLNLDVARVQGFEVSAAWRVHERLAVHLEYLFDDATVRRATVAPGLEGRRLAQVPKHGASLGATWQPARGWSVVPRVRWIGAQFEDDENLLELAPAVLGDLNVAWAPMAGWEFAGSVENVADARVESGRSTDELVNISGRRMISLLVRRYW